MKKMSSTIVGDQVVDIRELLRSAPPREILSWVERALEEDDPETPEVETGGPVFLDGVQAPTITIDQLRQIIEEMEVDDEQPEQKVKAGLLKRVVEKEQKANAKIGELEEMFRNLPGVSQGLQVHKVFYDDYVFKPGKQQVCTLL